MPQPASLQRHLSCVPGSCSSDYAGSEQQFGAIRLLPESNAAVRMLQKLFSLSLSFFFSLPLLGRKTRGRSGLGSPGTLRSLVPCPTPHAPHTQHPAPRLGSLPPAEGKSREGGFIRLTLTGKNTVSQPLGAS